MALKNSGLMITDIDTSFKVDEPAYFGAISKELRAEIQTQNVLRNYQFSEPLLTNSYAQADETFGVLNHADPIRGHYLNAFTNIESLRRLAAKGIAQASLADRILAYLKKHMSAHDFDVLSEELEVKEEIQKAQPFRFKRAIPKITGKILVDRYLRDPSVTESDPSAYEKDEVDQNAHSALFSTAEVLTDDIRKMESLRSALVNVRRQQQRDLKLKLVQRQSRENSMVIARKTLANLNNTRLDKLDDYALNQRLLADHWREVERKHIERRQILENHKGLYYVRVRETPMTATLPDPLDLLHRAPGDIVPGCSGELVSLAEELQPFMEIVLDIPAADWQALRMYRRFMPARQILTRMVNSRKQRLHHKLHTAQTSVTQLAAPRLIPLINHHQGMMQEIAALPFNASSVKELQRQAQRIVSLEDLLACPVPQLRKQAEQLHNNLHAAANCLLEGLRQLKPSIRLEWAERAEDDRLPMERPLEWPGLGVAEADDFNAIRNLVDLVEWWFSRLDDHPSSASLTSMRNLLRACLLLAAGDDPQQLLHGRLKTLPGRLRIGEVLRVHLNREPRPGTLLKLLNDEQKLIGTLRVDDHDNEGTVATFVNVLDSSVVLTTAMQVYGHNES